MDDNIVRAIANMTIQNGPRFTSASENTDSGIADIDDYEVSGGEAAPGIASPSEGVDYDNLEQQQHVNQNIHRGRYTPYQIVSTYNPSFHHLVLKWFEPDEDGDNDLLIALTHQDSDYDKKVAALLIDNAPNGSFLDVRNKYGLTALIIAVEFSDCAAIRRLRLAGANPNLSDSLGNTPAHYAANYGNREALLALTTEISSDEVALYNSPLKHEVIPLDLNVRNCDGKTALYIAVERRHTRIVTVLNNMRVNANSGENCAGRTALHAAVERGFLDCVQELLKIPDININSLTYAGHTPLDKTKILDSVVRKEMQDLLIRHGAENGEAESDDDFDMDNN